MPVVKLVIFFYSSILILIIITNGIIASRGTNLAPVLLLLPVAGHYLFAFTDQLTHISQFMTSPVALACKKGFAYYSFLIVLLFVVANLASSTSFFQATMTAFLLPLLFSFVLQIDEWHKKPQFVIEACMRMIKLRREQLRTDQSKALQALPDKSKGSKKKSHRKNQAHNEQITSTDSVQKLIPIATSPQNTDVNRRQFLKIVGGGGVSLIFMMFFMPQKASAAFFGSTPGPGIIGLKDSDGNKIDPAEKKPTDGYTISEIDDASSPSYYGFVHKSGAWYISREDSNGSYRYVAGGSGFSTNWTNRASLTYGYFDTVF